MRSSSSDDLNIQSSFTSSLVSMSSRLLREQNSVTMANIPESQKKPNKGLTFSCRRSFICKEDRRRTITTVFFQWLTVDCTTQKVQEGLQDAKMKTTTFIQTGKNGKKRENKYYLHIYLGYEKMIIWSYEKNK